MNNKFSDRKAQLHLLLLRIEKNLSIVKLLFFFIICHSACARFEHLFQSKMKGKAERGGQKY